MQNVDPLAVLETEAPGFSDEQAVDAARRVWGLDVTARPLVSERDQNFRLRTGDDDEYVLKIANAAEDPVVTDFQIRALLHIADRKRRLAIAVGAPEIVRTLDGETSCVLRSGTASHVARIVTFVAGKPLADRLPSPALAGNLGACLAYLGQALAGFEHPGSRQSLLWDMQQALGLRPLIRHIPEADAARAVSDALDDFERYAAPVLPALRAQVIHSDLNPDNIVIDPLDDDRIAGVIDFGDMLHAPLIADVAIACSYLREPRADPLTLIAEFVAGYHRITTLEAAEVDILFELIQARLCASISILDWRTSQRGPNDPYLERLVTGEGSGKHFLRRLREIPRDSARRVLQQVCASGDAADR